MQPKKIFRIALLIGRGSRVPAILECVKTIPSTQVVYVLSCVGEDIGIKCARRANIATGILNWDDYKDKKGGRYNFAARVRNLLKSYNADLIIMAGWKVIMPKTFVAEFRGRIVNIHPSILPAYPGKAENVIRAQWRDKAVPAGCTLHYVDEGVDTGKVVGEDGYGYVVRKRSDYDKFSSLEEFEAAIHRKEDEVLCMGIRRLAQELGSTKK